MSDRHAILPPKIAVVSMACIAAAKIAVWRIGRSGAPSPIFRTARVLNVGPYVEFPHFLEQRRTRYTKQLGGRLDAASGAH